MEKNFSVSLKIANHLSHISLVNKYIYFELPKNACSTVKKTLQFYENGLILSSPHDKKNSPLKHELDLIDDFENFYKFTFTRNPYTRILSCFLEKFRANNIKYSSYYKKLGLCQSDYTVDNNITFEMFLELLSKDGNIYKDNHWTPQSYLLPKFSLNFIGKFENFSQDFTFVLKKIFSNNRIEILDHRPHKKNANSLLKTI